MSGQVLRNMGRDVPPGARDIDGEEYTNWLAAQHPEPPRQSYVSRAADARTAQMNKDKLEAIVASHGSAGRVTDTVMANGYLYVYFETPVPEAAYSDMHDAFGQRPLPTDEAHVIAFEVKP